jgi:Domain of unknown function (DUF5076)
MSDPDDRRIYEALALPAEALDKGGLEILRAGLIEDELYVAARRVFREPATWGEVLGDIARRVATIYSLDDTGLSEKDIVADIVEAFAAEMGLPAVKTAKPTGKPAKKKQARPARKKSAKAKKSAKSAKRRKR